MRTFASVVVLVAIMSNAAASGNYGEIREERTPIRHCPLSKLQSVINNIDCSGTLLQCARLARAAAQRQFIDKGDHQGYAWGAVVIRSNSTVSDHIAWSMNAVKPSGWYCTTLSKSRTYVVHVFRTGYRYRNSTQDQWTYLVDHRHRDEVCPLLALKVLNSR